jgi:hypothetical protein
MENDHLSKCKQERSLVGVWERRERENNSQSHPLKILGQDYENAIFQIKNCWQPTISNGSI